MRRGVTRHLHGYRSQHQAGNGRGVALMRLALAELDLQRGGLCRCGSAAELATEAMEQLEGWPGC